MSRSVDSLKAFMTSSGRAPAYVPTAGVIAVGAGKGGVGTSTVAALLAIEAARRNERVLLVDADESVGSLAMLFSVDDPGPGLGALRGGVVEPESLVRPAAPGISLLAGGGGGIDATFAAAAGEHRALLRRVRDLYASYTTVIIDGGSRLETVLGVCGTGVERLLTVTSPERISLAASYALFKLARTRFEALPIELVVNGADDRRGRTLHTVVRTATQSFLGTDVRLGGAIPDDPGLRQQLERGGSIADLGPHGHAVSAAGGVVHRVLSERDTALGREPVFPILQS